ncbi:MAG TPA: CBO0543 family protein [Syntrophomonadaceae bacterium]|nr:CBO0543 family protein [Syntrophomonadaceae bacterium]
MSLDAGGYPSNDLIWVLEKQLAHARVENWRSEDLFTWQWWLLMAVLFIPWLLWWKYSDKKRLLEIGLFGLIIIIVSSYLDAVLTELGLWLYNFWVGPLNPTLLPIDFSLIPVVYMFIYQRYNDWKHFFIAMLIVSAFFSFIGEASLVWLGIYELHGWRYVYSFPIYAAIGMIARLIARWLTARQSKSA